MVEYSSLYDAWGVNSYVSEKNQEKIQKTQEEQNQEKKNLEKKNLKKKPQRKNPREKQNQEKKPREKQNQEKKPQKKTMSNILKNIECKSINNCDTINHILECKTCFRKIKKKLGIEKKKKYN